LLFTILMFPLIVVKGVLDKQDKPRR
jgi:hypothetical protein